MKCISYNTSSFFNRLKHQWLCVIREFLRYSKCTNCIYVCKALLHNVYLIELDADV